MKNPFAFLKNKFISSESGDTRNATGEITVRRSRAMDWTARIGVLLFSFALWFYVMATDSPTTQWDYKEIPVRIVNNSALSVLSGEGMTVDITVLGRRSQTKNVTPSDIDVYATVAPGTEAGRYSLDLSYNLPNGLSLSSSSQTKITIYLDNTTSVVVPVKAKIDDYMLEDGYELSESEIVCSPATVRITGPESLLKTVECAQVNLNLGKVTRTVSCTGSLKPVDANGETVTNSYITMQNSTVSITVPVYKYRSMPLQIAYKYGFFNETNASVTVEPATVMIRGEADAVDAASWVYTVDEKQILSDGTYNVALNLPDGVTNVSGISNASIQISMIGTVTKNIVVTNFKLINPDNVSGKVLTTAIPVTVRGPAALLKYLTAASTEAYVDLSSLKNTEGTMLLPVSFSFGGVYEGSVYEIGTYSVSVRTD